MSFVQIFYPVLAQKSSGFARILCIFCPKIAILKNSRGAQAPSPPPPPASYAYDNWSYKTYCTPAQTKTYAESKV